jgi:Uma2 family endonuclease
MTRNRKKDVYEGFGIRSYWIVSPDRDKPELVVFQLVDGRYELFAEARGDDPCAATLPFPVEVTPSELVSTAPLR